MMVSFDISGLFIPQPQYDFPGEMRAVCGPRYNTFSPEANRREEPGKFFLRDAWKLMRRVVEEEPDWQENAE